LWKLGLDALIHKLNVLKLFPPSVGWRLGWMLCTKG
jgi:hypothetical protein